MVVNIELTVYSTMAVRGIKVFLFCAHLLVDSIYMQDRLDSSQLFRMQLDRVFLMVFGCFRGIALKPHFLHRICPTWIKS